jgi:hypothetical protein
MQAAKGENAIFFTPPASLIVGLGMAGTATSGELNAIFAKYPPADFAHLGRTTTFAHGIHGNAQALNG